MSNGTVVSIAGVTKRFAGHTAVKSLSMDVPQGGIFGLLGPNGAGKSTTIRMMMNIISPDQGRIVVLGRESASRDLSDRIGYLPEERGLYKKMKVLDHLAFFGEAKGITRHEARQRAGGWLDRLGLADWKLKKVEDLSKGMQQKLQFAGALLHDPELIILDEPFSGLDPVNAKVMTDVVVDLARQGRTVLFSTHIMEQAEGMCDRIVIIARGEKVVDGTLAEVKRDFGGRHIALTFSRNADRAARVLADGRLVAKVQDFGRKAEAQLAPGADPDELLRTLVREDVGLDRFEVVEASLRAIFVAKVGAEAAIAPAQDDGRRTAEVAHA
ncbi:MAG TPA: ATP-binding cassette domain-containing protein [Gemmatimonadales bacterium]|nr:ATP-binding cassette domain-containing protein [Gemmatimonadales bacterium]